MTSYGMQVLAGPVITSIASKEKGSMGNRMDCAGAHIKNNVSTAVQTAAVGGAAFGAARVAATDVFGGKKLTKSLSKLFDGTLKLIGKIAKKPDFAKNTIKDLEYIAQKHTTGIGKYLGSLSARYKALAVIAAVVLPTLGYIAHKHSYKSGQIDQKYTDKAQFQKTL